MPQNKGYIIYNHLGETKKVSPEHTPIIDKLAADDSDESINNFYNLAHIPSNTVKITKDNVTKDYDVRSKEYIDLYNSGNLTNYDPKTNSYVPKAPLKEVTVTAEAPQWLKNKRALSRNYTKEPIIIQDPEKEKVKRYQEKAKKYGELPQIKGYENETIDINSYKTKEQIMELQSKLVSKNYDLGKFGKNKDGVDGLMGAKTREAVMQYNKLSKKGELSFNPIKKDKAVRCEEDQCATYNLKELHRISNNQVSADEFAKTTGIGVDSWKAAESIISKGGSYVYNAQDKIDRKGQKPKVGDVVLMYTGGLSTYQKKADKYGDGLTHQGFISKVYEDGSYDIDHNVHKSSRKSLLSSEYEYVGNSYTSRVSNNITQDNKFIVKKILRPNYNVDVKQITSNPNIKIVSKNNPVAANYYNNNKEAMSKMFKLDEDELTAISKAALGIIDQETKGGKAFEKKVLGQKVDLRKPYETLVSAGKMVKAAFTDDEYGVNTEASKGYARMKYDMNFTEAEQQNIKKTLNIEDETSMEGSFVFAIARLSKDYARYLKKGVPKDKALYKAITAYNAPGKADSEFAENYDVDYTNKVINYGANNEVREKDKKVGTILDSLAGNKEVVKNSSRLKKVISTD